MSRSERALQPSRSALDRFGYDLRRLRKDRGYSLARLAGMVYVSSDLIQKIEVAERRASRELTEQLDAALGADGGLLASWDKYREQTRPHAPSSNGDVAMLWHPAASAIAPDPDLYARITSALEAESHPDSAVISWLERCLAEHRKLEDATGAGPIVSVVKSQLSVVAKLAQHVSTPLTVHLVDLAAQYAQFMAWLCNDQGNKGAALAWYDRSHDWAMEAGDANMAATTLSMKAHLAWSVGNSNRCIRLGEAARWNDDSASPGVQGMAAQMIARGQALSSNADSAHRAIDDAQSLVMAAAESPEDEPSWMYFYGETWFTAQRGMIETELAERGKGKPRHAVMLLERALNDLPEAYRRDRAWYGTMLARAYAVSDDCDAAADTGVKFAADAIDVNKYAVGELRQLSTTLNQRGVHQARDLSDALGFA